MTDIFDGPASPLRRFRAFSARHLISAGVVLIVIAFIVAFRQPIRTSTADPILRWSFAAILILNEAGLGLWRARHGLWTLQDSLPLHLCGVSVILVAIMLPLKSYAIFELTYFWAVGGALQGLITPDVEGFDFPHWRFLTTFISHGLIVAANLYMIVVLGMRPTFLSLLKSLVVLNIYGVLTLGFNALTRSNYGFLCRKPEQPTLYDVLGPWPWYLASLEGLAIGISFIVFVPFLIFS
jgi:hypothetical integral membrane protein (TIGR02206 family)